VLNTNSTALQAVQNERPELGGASKRWYPPEMSEVSSEVETWPTRTTSYYNVRNNRKTECDYRLRSKTPDIFGKLKNSPRTQLSSLKKRTCGKPGSLLILSFFSVFYIDFPINKTL
jgi:hypothetical protein